MIKWNIKCNIWGHKILKTNLPYHPLNFHGAPLSILSKICTAHPFFLYLSWHNRPDHSRGKKSWSLEYICIIQVIQKSKFDIFCQIALPPVFKTCKVDKELVFAAKRVLIKIYYFNMIIFHFAIQLKK